MHSAAQPPASVRPGQVIADKYWVERVLGRGGMGTVVLATHLQLGHRVALKFLRPSIAQDETNYLRFQREARATAQLRGEHVVRVLDVGTTEHHAPFIVMEYLAGHDLEAVVASGPLDVATAVDYILQAANAIAEAHAAGIIHRDLKPSNIFITTRPDGGALVKVMDFGLAKWLGETRFDLTSSRVILGSPGYMPPEQLRNPRAVDTRADIWSLGAVLYELVSGRRPYEATTLAELVARALTEPVSPLPLQLPAALSRVVMRCLEREADDRYQTVQDVVAALMPFGSSAAPELARRVGQIAVRGQGPAQLPVCAAPTLDVAVDAGADTELDVPELRHPRTPRWMLAIVAVLMSVAIVLGAALVVKRVRHRRGSRSESRAQTAMPTAMSPLAPSIEVIPLPPIPEAAAAAPPSPSESSSTPPRKKAPRLRPRAGNAKQVPAGARSANGASTEIRAISGDLDGDGIPDIR